MSVATAALFGWVQSAPGYRTVHDDAVRLLGPGEGRTWLDVGCGAGLVTHLAAGHGYRAHGIDRDPAMTRLARVTTRRGDHCTFAVGDAAEPLPPADVVSAAHVVCHADDPAAMLRNLWDAVRPGGALLLVETTSLMSVDAVRRAPGPDDWHSRQVMQLWARARQGHALPDDVHLAIPATSRRTVPMLGGGVEAVVLTKGA